MRHIHQNADASATQRAELCNDAAHHAARVASHHRRSAGCHHHDACAGRAVGSPLSAANIRVRIRARLQSTEHFGARYGGRARVLLGLWSLDWSQLCKRSKCSAALAPTVGLHRWPRSIRVRGVHERANALAARIASQRQRRRRCCGKKKNACFPLRRAARRYSASSAVRTTSSRS